VFTDPDGSEEFLLTPGDANSGDDRAPALAKESFWKALNELPEELKTVILLRQQMDLSFVDIAERMQREVEGVQTLWSQALVVLGRKLEERE
jgi:DNA-directed RNA polymerase specialized sigma24 family protein